MKILLEVNEQQAETLKKALELFGRIGMGQLHDLEYHPAFESRSYDMGIIDDYLDKVKEEVFKDLYGRGHSYGIRHEKTHETSKEAFDMYQVIRHALAWHRDPNGKPWNTHYDEPVQFSQQPLIKCKIIEDNK